MARGTRTTGNGRDASVPAGGMGHAGDAPPRRRRRRTVAAAHTGSPPEPGAPSDAAALLDGGDQVLRVLADLDFDPSRMNGHDGEHAPRDPAAPGTETKAGPNGHEAYISNILAELMEDDRDEVAAVVRGQVDPRPPRRVGIRMLEVALARGRNYLDATSGIEDVGPAESAQALGQARALIDYLKHVPGPLRADGQGLGGTIDIAIVDLGERLANAMMARFPASKDIDAPVMTAGLWTANVYVSGPAPADAADADEVGALRRLLAETMRALVARRARVDTARISWALGSDLLGEIERLRALT